MLVGLTLVTAVISSLGAPLLPSIADSLSVSLSSAQWSLTAALLAGAVAAPVLGRLGDGRYRREAMLGALIVIFLGGFVAAAAQTLPLLVLGRAMQGVGLGTVPLAMASARATLPPDRVPGVIGLLSVSGATGVGAGFPLSGLIASQLGLDAAFLFGSVISGLALIAAFLVIPSSRGAGAVKLDMPGAAIGSVIVIALLLGISQGGQWGWGSPATIAAFGVAAATLLAWVVHQRHVTTPLVDLRQLRHASVVGADIAALLLGIGLYIFLTVVTDFVQVPEREGFGFGESTLVAGLCLVPFSVFSLLASRVPSAFPGGIRVVLILGALAISGSGTFFALVHEELWQAFVTMGILGVGFGFTFAALPGLIVGSVPDREVGSAMGFYQVIRAIGFSIGSALVAAVLAAYESGGADHPDQDGFLVALWAGVGVCFLAALLVAFVVPERSEYLGGPEIREDAELASVGLIDVGVSSGSGPR